MEDHGHKELKNTFSFMGNINDELWYLFLLLPSATALPLV